MRINQDEAGSRRVVEEQLGRLGKDGGARLVLDLYLAYISPTSPLHLPISPLYLPYYLPAPRGGHTLPLTLSLPIALILNPT